MTLDAVVSGFGGSLNSESAESSPLAPDQPKLLLFLADKDRSNQSQPVRWYVYISSSSNFFPLVLDVFQFSLIERIKRRRPFSLPSDWEQSSLGAKPFWSPFSLNQQIGFFNVD